MSTKTYTYDEYMELLAQQQREREHDFEFDRSELGPQTAAGLYAEDKPGERP